MDDVTEEGPYKVVSSRSSYRGGPTYSIVVQKKMHFFQEVVPDAGSGETARQICNLLNKQFKERLAPNYDEEKETYNDETPTLAGTGNGRPDELTYRDGRVLPID